MTEVPNPTLHISIPVLRKMLNSVSPSDPATLSQFLDDAITTYLRLADLRQSGGTLFFSDKDGVTRKVVLPFDLPIQTAASGQLTNIEG